MTQQESAPLASDWKGLYKAGGISLIIAGVLFILNMPLFFLLGPPPTNGDDAIRWVASGKLIFQVVNGFFLAAAILFVPAILALYSSLSKVARAKATIGAGLAGVAIPVFIMTIAVHYSLITTKTPAVAEFIVNADAAGELVSGLLFSIATLIISLAMLRGVFGKGVAYLGIATGVIGIIGSYPIGALAVLGVISLLLFAIWFLAVGFKLSKMG